MRTAAPTNMRRRELAVRVTGDLEVTLYWSPRDNSVSVEVHQLSTEETITFGVPPDRALDAFHHPFAHLADRDQSVLQEAVDAAIALGGWHMN